MFRKPTNLFRECHVVVLFLRRSCKLPLWLSAESVATLKQTVVASGVPPQGQGLREERGGADAWRMARRGCLGLPSCNAWSPMGADFLRQETTLLFNILWSMVLIRRCLMINIQPSGRSGLKRLYDPRLR